MPITTQTARFLSDHQAEISRIVDLPSLFPNGPGRAVHTSTGHCGPVLTWRTTLGPYRFDVLIDRRDVEYNVYVHLMDYRGARLPTITVAELQAENAMINGWHAPRWDECVRVLVPTAVTESRVQFQFVAESSGCRGRVSQVDFHTIFRSLESCANPIADPDGGSVHATRSAGAGTLSEGDSSLWPRVE